MKERPILFSGAMVRAILEGRKTQTRRIVKPQPESVDHISHKTVPYNGSADFLAKHLKAPHGQPGDCLWVKETFFIDDYRFYPSGRLPKARPDLEQSAILYRADGTCCEQLGECECGGEGAKWRPSIFMPRWASRISLRIVSTRIERLQELTADDALAEGVQYPVREVGGGKVAPLLNISDPFLVPHLPARDKITHERLLIAHYAGLWDSLNSKPNKASGLDYGHPWASNPWVWRIEFEVAMNAGTHPHA